MPIWSTFSYEEELSRDSNQKVLFAHLQVGHNILRYFLQLLFEVFRVEYGEVWPLFYRQENAEEQKAVGLKNRHVLEIFMHLFNVDFSRSTKQVYSIKLEHVMHDLVNCQLMRVDFHFYWREHTAEST